MSTPGYPRDLVLCIGRIYCDLVFTGLNATPQQGREVFASGFTPALGGGAYIAAAHLASLGRRTALVARYGTDPLSLALGSQLSGIGASLEFIEHAADAGPQVTVVTVEGGERAFLSHRAGRAEPRTANAALAHPSATHLHIAEYATLAEIPRLVARARMNGLTVSLDPSWDDSLIHDPDLIEACKGIDIFLPNLSEAQAITGKDRPLDVLDALAPHFPTVALKLGADGALLHHAGRPIAERAPVVPVVDTTGAGDAFNAGLINAWLRGGGPRDWLTAAISCGSRSVQAVGGATALGDDSACAG